MQRRQSAGIRVLLAGGGTGGHVFPALVVADELRSRGCSVSWLGRADGMEKSLVEASGLTYSPIEAKPWLGQGMGERLGALLTLWRSARRTRRLIKERQIAITVGTGGYVSAPAVVGSFLARRPCLLFEPNARAGKANRWLSRISTAACTGYEETGRELACRTVWTGIPVRAEFFAAGEPPGDRPSVLIVGGSQGALQINTLLPPVVERLARRYAKLKVVHQVGEAHLSTVKQDYSRCRLETVELRLVPFIENMAAAMREAQVVVSRAGALTLAEVAASGRPSVLIPLAAAAGHQAANAARLKAAGAAEVLRPEASTVDVLEALLGALLDDGERRRRMATAARRLARADAAQRVADLVEELGRAA